MKQTAKTTFRSKMSLNWAFKAITYLLVYGVGVCLPTLMGILYANIFENSTFLIFPIPFVAVFLSVWITSPKAISITKDHLQIERPVGKLRFKLSDIKKVEKIPVLQDYAGFALRLWGSGGAWGNFGYFWSRKLGVFKLYLTNNNFALVEMKNGKKMFVSPDDREKFIEEMKKLIHKKK